MDIKILLREGLINEGQENRYLVDANFFVYADDLKQAKVIADKWAYEMRNKLDNQAQITHIRLNQFGKM